METLSNTNVKGGFIMKRWFKWFLTSAFIAIMTVNAEAQTVTKGRDLGLDIGSMKAQRVEFFSDFDIGTQVGTHSAAFFVYNEVANDFGTLTATGGEVKCLAEGSFSKTIGIAVSTMKSSSIDWQVEGRFGTASQYAILDSGNIAATTTTDIAVRIEHDIEAIRVGLKPLTSVDSGGNIDVYGLFRGRY